MRERLYAHPVRDQIPAYLLRFLAARTLYIGSNFCDREILHLHFLLSMLH